MFSSVRTRLATAARWLAPSAACACAGALAGGALEGVGIGGVEGVLVATGFLAMVVLPALFVASVAARGVYALWQPDALLAGLVEDGGGAPRFAGWLAFLYLAGVGLAWTIFQGTWLLASSTSFKPMTLGFAQPVLAVGATVLLAALSRPTVRLVAALARRLDRRWQRRGRRTLLRPRLLVAGTAAVVLATAYLVWRVTVRPRIGPLDTSIFHGPAGALVATGVAHALWNRARRRRTRAIAGGVTTALAATAVVIAVLAARTSPSLTLEIWVRSRSPGSRSSASSISTRSARTSRSPRSGPPIARAPRTPTSCSSRSIPCARTAPRPTAAPRRCRCSASSASAAPSSTARTRRATSRGARSRR